MPSQASVHHQSQQWGMTCSWRRAGPRPGTLPPAGGPELARISMPLPGGGAQGSFMFVPRVCHLVSFLKLIQYHGSGLGGKGAGKHQAAGLHLQEGLGRHVEVASVIPLK